MTGGITVADEDDEDDDVDIKPTIFICAFDTELLASIQSEESERECEKMRRETDRERERARDERDEKREKIEKAREKRQGIYD